MSSIPPEPTKEEIFTLRKAANQQIDQAGASNYDARDLQRINGDDDYIRRFLMHHDNDQKLALEMVMNTLKWRKENAVNDITAEKAGKKFFDLANLFIHNRDTDGCKILMFLAHKHFKGVDNIDELKIFFIYWLERLEREENGKWITVFFDMRDTGMKNMDMDFIQYMINLFQSYYPWILNNIIVFEMPWLLNAMWSIIKSWLPPKSVEKIKFLNKKALSQYVASDQSLVAWGGTDSYTFKFETEKMRPLPWAAAAEADARKQVTFSDSTASSAASLPPATAVPVNAASGGAYVQLSPADELVFDPKGGSAVITITNPSAQPLFFKVKTTSPDKFRVRPSVGGLGGGASCTVSVAVLNEATPQALVREKFLVMTLNASSEHASQQDITHAFKTAPKEALSEVRLRVGVAVASQNGGPPQHTAAEAQVLAKLEELLRGQRAVQDHLDATRRFILLIVVLMVAALVLLVVANNTMQGAALLQQTTLLQQGQHYHSSNGREDL